MKLGSSGISLDCREHHGSGQGKPQWSGKTGIPPFFLDEKVKISRPSPPTCGYRNFNSSGYARLAWNLAVRETDPGVVKLSTETRVMCLDDQSRRRFRLYWFLVGRFVG